MFRKVSQSVRYSLRLGPRKQINLELAKQWIQDNLPSVDPFLASVNSMKDLFSHLKSGHILCRILGYKYGREITGVKSM